MAENTTKQVILDIQVDYKTAINNIVKLQGEIDKLKVAQLQEQAAVKSGTKTREEADKALEAINAELRLLRKNQREYRNEIDANLQAEEANNGSLKEMRANLKLLIQQYDALSQVDREQVGGIGEQKLLEIRRLQEELRQAEEASGRFQRSVGSYEDAIRNALNGTIPLKTAVKDLKNEIATLEFQYRQTANDIRTQEALVAQLSAEVGVESDEYTQAAASLEQMKKAYEDTGKTLETMKQATGQMVDSMSDANESIKNFSQDNANLKAAKEGAQLLLNSYTALQAGMTALGVESEELMNVFAKIQILQQGLNAVTAIAKTLEEQSILRQQARVLWNTLTTTSINSMAAAKKKDAAASVEAAAADVTLAAGETTATAAAGGLTAALRAVGVAIKNIPIIGWLAAGVALLGTIIGLVVKANKESKKGEESLKSRMTFYKQIADAEKEAYTSVSKQVVQMQNNIRHLKTLKQDTSEWSALVATVANDLGVSVEWLKQNISKVDELKNKWIEVQTALAKADQFAKLVAENEAAILTLEQDLRAIVNSTDYNKRTDEIVKQYKVSYKLAEEFVKADNARKKADTTENYVRYANALNAINEALNNRNKILNNEIDKQYNKSVAAQNDLKELADGNIEDVNKTITSTSTKTAASVKKTYKELSEELEDLIIENMADGVEKEVAQVEKASERWVAEMKKARDEDTENKELYDKLIAEKEKQTAAKVRKIRGDAYAKMAEDAKKVAEAYNSLWAAFNTSPFSKFMADFNKMVADVLEQIDELNGQGDGSNQIGFFEKQFIIDENKKKALQEYAQTIQEVVLQQAQTGTVTSPDNIGVMIDANIDKWRKEIARLYGQIESELRNGNTEAAEELQKQLADAQNQLSAQYGLKGANAKANSIEQQEMQIQYGFGGGEELQAAQLQVVKLQNAIQGLSVIIASGQQTQNEINGLTEQNNTLLNERLNLLGQIGTAESEEEKKSLEAQLAVVDTTIENNAALIDNLKLTLAAMGYTSEEEMGKILEKMGLQLKQAENNVKKVSTGTISSVLRSVATVSQAFTDLFNQIGEDNEQMNGFLEAMAYTQIGVNLAVAIAEAVAAGAGQVFPYNLAAIAAGIAAVVGAIGSAIATYKQYHSNTKAPKFAEGGFVSGEKGVDKVPAWLTDGEYVIRRKRVSELGLPFLDALNNGSKFANGGYVTTNTPYNGGYVSTTTAKAMNETLQMEAMMGAMVDAISEIEPVVSVREIARVQNRVGVKQSISKNN